MKIEVNVKKKYFFSIMSVLLVLAGVFMVYAYTNTLSVIPNPGHALSSIQGYLENDVNLNYTLGKLCQSDGTNCETATGGILDIFSKEVCFNVSEGSTTATRDRIMCPSGFSLRGFDFHESDNEYGTCCGIGAGQILVGFDAGGAGADPDCWIKYASNVNTTKGYCRPVPPPTGNLPTYTAQSCINAAMTYYNQQPISGVTGGWLIGNSFNTGRSGASGGVCSDGSSQEWMILLKR